MNAEEFNIKVRAVTEINELQKLEDSLRQQIDAAKAAGDDYLELSRRLEEVKRRAAELNAEAEKTPRLFDASGRAVNSSKQAFAGFHQVQAALARLMRGDVVGAAQAASAAFKGLTAVARANPFTFWIGALAAVITVITQFISWLGKAAEASKKLTETNFDQFIAGVREAGAAAKQLNDEKYAAQQASVRQLIEQQREYQAELDRTRVKQIALVDADLAEQIANINLKKQTDLGGATTQRQREDIEAGATRAEFEARREAAGKKAAAELDAAAKSVGAAQAGVETATAALEAFKEEVAAASQVFGAALATVSATPGAVSDQQKIFDRIAQLEQKRDRVDIVEKLSYPGGPGTAPRVTREEVKPGLSVKEQAELAELMSKVQAATTAIAEGAITFTDAVKDLEEKIKSGKGTTADVAALEAIKNYNAAKGALDAVQNQKDRDPNKLTDAIAKTEAALRDAQDRLAALKQSQSTDTTVTQAREQELNNSDAARRKARELEDAGGAIQEKILAIVNQLAAIKLSDEKNGTRTDTSKLEQQKLDLQQQFQELAKPLTEQQKEEFRLKGEAIKAEGEKIQREKEVAELFAKLSGMTKDGLGDSGLRPYEPGMSGSRDSRVVADKRRELESNQALVDAFAAALDTVVKKGGATPDHLNAAREAFNALPDVARESFKGLGDLLGQLIQRLPAAGATPSAPAPAVPPPASPSAAATVSGVKSVLDVLVANAGKNFVDRILNASQYPVMDNGDGSYSTHQMGSAEVDGKQIAYPTLFYDQDKNSLYAPDDAIAEALRTGNYIIFETAEEAQRFAEGGYKAGFDKGPELGLARRNNPASPSAPAAPPPVEYGAPSDSATAGAQTDGGAVKSLQRSAANLEDKGGQLAEAADAVRESVEALPAEAITEGLAAIGDAIAGHHQTVVDALDALAKRVSNLEMTA